MRAQAVGLSGGVDGDRADDGGDSAGETPELQPNASAALDLTLAAGSYLLICNVSGYYASGMVVPLVVAP